MMWDRALSTCRVGSQRYEHSWGPPRNISFASLRELFNLTQDDNPILDPIEFIDVTRPVSWILKVHKGVTVFQEFLDCDYSVLSTAGTGFLER
ncbi:hypothetical protein AV521_37785 [Streptomyces sp. IMTB 2501]|nr:hypothetical protein AV521_37785 [Streptomyces sp. IMTB 2501]